MVSRGKEMKLLDKLFKRIKCVCGHSKEEHNTNSLRCLMSNCDCTCYEGEDITAIVNRRIK